jgi:hypothetical protein
MHQKEAFDLVNRVVTPGHLMDYAALSGQILYAALAGVEDEELPGEPVAPETGLETHQD